MWEDIADCSGSMIKKHTFFCQVFYKSYYCNVCVQRLKLLHLWRAYEFLISRRVFQSDTWRVPIITLPFTENMSWTTPSRTVKKNWGMFKECQKVHLCVRRLWWHLFFHRNQWNLRTQQCQGTAGPWTDCTAPYQQRSKTVYHIFAFCVPDDSDTFKNLCN